MLARPSTAELLADDLRREILDGEPAAGERLVERELVERYGVARHTLRAALRQLAAEGLVRIEPHRGATVARLGPEDIRWLYELRAALELEAAHLALERHGGRLPEAVHRALAALVDACSGPDAAWSEVSHAHAALHSAIVAASGSPRIVAAHAALTGELLLFLLQLQPHVEADELAADHVALVAALARAGAGDRRPHLRQAAETRGAEPPCRRPGRTACGRPPGDEEGSRKRPGGEHSQLQLPRHAVSETRGGQSRDETRCICPGSSSG
jgi:DNA-binding GntR family transcriptional regulator